MAVQLDNEIIEINPEIQSLALYGYAVFSAFTATKNENKWKIKGLELHLARLERDSNAIFGISTDQERIKKGILFFLNSHSEQHSMVVRVTLFPKNFSLAQPEKIEDIHVLISGRPHSSVKNKPLKLTIIDERRIFAQHKTTNMISNLYARAVAHQNGFDDALMSINNFVTEGATWNIFFFDGINLVTPELSDNLLLPGITRHILIKNSSNCGFNVLEQKISISDIKNYKLAFITNAAIGVSTVTSIDNIVFYEYNAIIENILNIYNSFPSSTLE